MAIVSIMPITALIGFFLNFCIKEDLRRLKYDKKESEAAPLKSEADPLKAEKEMVDIEKIEMVEVRNDEMKMTTC